MDKWLSHPTALKIISVILGVLLFAIVHVDPETSPQSVTSNIDTKVIEAVTIAPVGLDTEKYVLTAMEPTVARLVVEGRISTLRTAANEEYIVNVDLEGIEPGLHELPLTSKLPRNIKEVELSPRKVMVQIEELVTKSFDVQVLASGQPAEGYVLGTPEVVSDTGSMVQVTLPKDDMSRVGLVAVTLDVAGADKTVVNKKASIVVYDNNGVEIPGAVIEPGTVHAEAPITLPFKSVPLQIRYTGTLDSELSLVSVKPVPDEITIYAQQSQLDATAIFDGIVLDLSKVKGSGQVKVKALPVDGIASVFPAEVTLDVVVERTATRTFSALPITISGLENGLTAEFQEPVSGMMSMVLSGAEAVLQDVKATDIGLQAKVEGLPPGVHSVPLEIDLPPYVEPVLGDGQQLTVKIEIVDETAANNDNGSSGNDLEVGGTPTDTPVSGTPIEEETEEEDGSIGEGSGDDGSGGSGNSASSRNANALADRSFLARTSHLGQG